jgi:hypothetical protein
MLDGRQVGELDSLAADDEGVGLGIGRCRRFEEVIRVRPEPRQLRRLDEFGSRVVGASGAGKLTIRLVRAPAVKALAVPT